MFHVERYLLIKQYTSPKEKYFGVTLISQSQSLARLCVLYSVQSCILVYNISACTYLKYQYGVKKLAHYFTVHTPTMINIFHSFPLFTGKVAKHKCKWHIYIIGLKTVFFCICYHLLSKHLIQLNIFCQFFNKPNRFCPPSRLWI